MTREQALELHLVGGEFELCSSCDGSGQELDIDSDMARWIPCHCYNGCVPTVRYEKALKILETEAVEPASSTSSELLVIRDMERAKGIDDEGTSD